MGVRRIQFLSSGFQQILTGAGVGGVVASEARKQAAQMEAATGEPYAVEQLTGATSRTVYVAKPASGEYPRVKGLTHEKWMTEVWPRVGGPAWRPHR